MSIKSFVNIKNKYDRLVVLIDMDCFYCQVEEKLKPELKGRPIAVVQYNAWKGGGIIAVNYEARDKGVTRHMRGEEAKSHCPEIELVTVPVLRGKADLTKYREAGKDVADVLQKFTPLLERASVDEAYLDITAKVVETMKLMNEGKYRLEPDKLLNTYAMGFGTIGEFVQNLSKIVDNDDIPDIEDEDLEAYKKSDIKLLIAAAIVNEIRATVKSVTGYNCSAGIAHNKILAKYACGLNKPNKQTLLPLSKIPGLLAELPLKKIKGLGGKLGELVAEKLAIKFIGDLTNFTEQELQSKIDDKNGSWLYLMARGIDLECVQPKFLSKSIGCSKNFPGRTAIQGIQTLTHWLSELSCELTERLEKDEIDNNRRGKQLVVGFTQTLNKEDVASSRATPLNSYESEIIAREALDIIKKNTVQFFKAGSETVLNNSVKHLSISVGKFEDIGEKSNRIQQLFSNHTKRKENELKEIPEKIEEPTLVPKKTNKLQELFSNHRKSCMSNVEKEEGSSSTHVVSKTNSIHEMFKNAKKPLVMEGHTQKKGEDILAIFNSFDEDSVGVDKPIPMETVEATGEKSNGIQQFSTNQGNQNQVKEIEASTLVPKKTNKLQQLFNNHRKSCDDEDEKIGNPLQQASKTNSVLDMFKNAKTMVLTEDQIKKKEDDILAIFNSFEDDSVGVEQPLIKTKTVDRINSEFEKVKPSFFQTYIEETDVSVVSNSPQAKVENIHENQINPGPSTSSDYTSTYIEFQRPVNIDEIKTVCAQCNKSIPDYEYQSHLDFHFALELSQQQRHEFRTELKVKSGATPPPNKKLKTTTASGKIAPISRFLIKTDEIREADHALAKQKCPECGKHIEIEKLMEHSDYHAARKLQNELNSQTIQISTSQKIIVDPSSSKSKKPNAVTVLSYFNKK